MGQQSYFELAPRVWRRWACLADQDFWALGTLERSADSPGMREAGLPHFRAYRVRLERAGVERIMDGAFGPATRLGVVGPELAGDRSGRIPTPPSIKAKKNPRPKIDPATLKAWVADFGARNPGTSFAVFRDNARLAFPRYRVGERPVKAIIAELGFTLMPGNPATLRK